MSSDTAEIAESSEGPDEMEETSTSGSEGLAEANEGVTFGERIQDSQTGHLQKADFSINTPGTKQQTYRKAGKETRTALGTAPKTKFKRDNKNRPAEQSSKRPVPRFREIIEAGNRQAVDPRFDDLAGKFREETFKSRYAFLYDEQLPQEKSELRKRLKSARGSGKKEQLQAELMRVEQQIKAETEQRKRQAAQKAVKAKEKEAVKAGKKPFFLKKSEKKKQELIRKYQELKASGGLEKAMAKRRRKNAAKDHRLVPSTR